MFKDTPSVRILHGKNQSATDGVATRLNVHFNSVQGLAAGVGSDCFEP